MARTIRRYEKERVQEGIYTTAWHFSGDLVELDDGTYELRVTHVYADDFTEEKYLEKLRAFAEHLGGRKVRLVWGDAA